MAELARGELAGVIDLTRRYNDLERRISALAAQGAPGPAGHARGGCPDGRQDRRGECCVKRRIARTVFNHLTTDQATQQANLAQAE